MHDSEVITCVHKACLCVWVVCVTVDLDDRVSARLSPGPCPDPKDGICDWHAVFSTDGVEQSHGDAEKCHAEHTAASPTPQPPHKADSVHGRPGDLERTQRFSFHSTAQKRTSCRCM